MFFSKQNYMGVYHYCLKTEILNLGLLGVFDSCRQSSSLWFQSLLVFMKEFSSSKCIRILWLYNDTFTLTEENLMNSSKSVKLRPYRSKNTSSRCQTWALWLLIWRLVPFPLGINMMLKLGLSILPARLGDIGWDANKRIPSCTSGQRCDGLEEPESLSWCSQRAVWAAVSWG